MEENGEICPPQKLDLERLRLLLDDKQYADIRYHEPLLYNSHKSSTHSDYMMLIVTGTAIKLFELRRTRQRPITIRFKNVLELNRLGPESYSSNGYRVNQASNVSLIVRVTTETQEFDLCIYLPDSKAFFYIQSECNAYLTDAVLGRHRVSRNSTPSFAVAEEVISEISQDFMHTKSLQQKIQLLNELSDASISSLEVKQAFFQSKVKPLNSIDSFTDILLRDLKAYQELPKAKTERITQLSYLKSVLQALASALHGSASVSERMLFVRQSKFSFSELVNVFILTYDVKPDENEKNVRAQEATLKSNSEEQSRRISMITSLRTAEITNPSEDTKLKSEIIELQMEMLILLNELLQQALLTKERGFPQDSSIAAVLVTHEEFESWFTKFLSRLMKGFTTYANEDASKNVISSPISHKLWQLCEMLYILLVGDYRVRKIMNEDHSETLEFFIRGKRFRQCLEAKLNVHDSLTLLTLSQISKASAQILL